VEIIDIELDELDQGDGLRQSEGHGAAVGGAELLLQVHLGDLPGQLSLQAIFPGPPLVQGRATDRGSSGPGPVRVFWAIWRASVDNSCKRGAR
jgi:hypothetical protein